MNRASSTWRRHKKHDKFPLICDWMNVHNKPNYLNLYQLKLFSFLKNCFYTRDHANYQSIVGTELFPFNSRSVHVHERNFGHFFKGNSVMNVNGTLVTFSQWTECKSLFIFSVRAEHIFAKKAFETFLSKHIFHFFLKKSFGFNCCWIIKQINFRWITKWHHP